MRSSLPHSNFHGHSKQRKVLEHCSARTKFRRLLRRPSGTISAENCYYFHRSKCRATLHIIALIITMSNTTSMIPCFHLELAIFRLHLGPLYRQGLPPLLQLGSLSLFHFSPGRFLSRQGYHLFLLPTPLAFLFFCYQELHRRPGSTALRRLVWRGGGGGGGVNVILFLFCPRRGLKQAKLHKKSTIRLSAHRRRDTRLRRHIFSKTTSFCSLPQRDSASTPCF